MHDEPTIRPFSSMREYHACTELQEDVWGRGFSEKVSAAILMIANRIGGLAAGAFDPEGGLQGFVFGLTGVVEGRLIHWSDMLAVRGSARDGGLGTRLKLFQREVLLGRGVDEMRWTFDPLQGRNAHVNLAKLGVICREYVEDMYGETDSPLHRGIGTDRLVATWEMDSPRARMRLEGAASGPSKDGVAELPRVLSALEGGRFPRPGAPVLDRDEQRLLLAVPATIDAMMAEEVETAVRWRRATREAFRHYVSRGYEVREFVRGGRVSTYLLERP